MIAAEPALARSRVRFFRPSDPSLGLQIYTLGPETFSDLDATFTEVAKIGYRSVELLTFCGHKPAEVRAALDRTGIMAGGSQIAFQDFGSGYDLAGHLEATIEGAQIVGLQTIAAPIFAFPARFVAPKDPSEMGGFIARTAAAMTADDWKAHADTLNRTGEILKRNGISLAHHNHNTDFIPVGETTGYDIIVRNTDPAFVSLELDIGWVAAAGLDPVAILERYSGRFSLMHVKDVKASTKPNYALAQDPAVVGQGSLDFARILPAARAAGVRHFYVEQEPPFAIPRIEAARQSYNFLTRDRP